MKRKLIKLLSVGILSTLSISFISPYTIKASEIEDSNIENVEALTQEKIDEANDAYNNISKKVDFISMSDTEFGSYDAKNWNYKRIAEWAKSKNFNIQAVEVAGDVVGANEPEYYAHVNNGDDVKVQGWYRAVEQCFTENFGDDVYVMLANGNHDIADILGETMDEMHKDDDKWYYGDSSTNYASNFHVKINGIDFITLDYNGTATFGYGNAGNGYQDFLKDTMKEITEAEDYDPTKPIFIQAHSGYTGTSLGGPWAPAYDMVGMDLQNILKDYPQVIIGSGHTHFSMGGEFGIYQDNFTFYENQSMNYMYEDAASNFVENGYGINTGNMESYALACNFISVLEDGTTVIRRYDVSNNRWMGMPWVIDTKQGKEGFKYTNDKRSKIAPWFEEDNKVTTTDVTETSVVLGFDQACDEEQVNNYSIKITDAEGNPVSVKVHQLPDKNNSNPKTFSNGEFRAYSRYFFRPNIMSFEISNLEPGGKYNVEIYAYDDFENKSKKPLVGSFKTQRVTSLKDVEGDVSLPEDIEDDKYFNMNFEENLTDSIGESDGVIHGNVSYVDSYHEKNGKAINIAQGNGNYIDLGNREEWNLGTDKNITVNFWIKVNAHYGYSAILSNKPWSSFTREGFNLAPRAGSTSTLELSLGDGSNGTYAFSDVDNYMGSWHMMSFTIDRNKETSSIYLDGKKVNETSISHIGSMTSGQNMYLGIDASKSYGNIGFYMDDLDMWSRALSDEDIKALYNVSNYNGNEKLLKNGIEFAESYKEEININKEAGRIYDEELIDKLDKAIEDAKNAEVNEYLSAYMEIKEVTDEITESKEYYKVEVQAENGSITPNEAVVEKGNSATFELTPNVGYGVKNLELNITPESDYVVEGNKLIVNNIEQGTKISVKFAEAELEITDFNTSKEDGIKLGEAVELNGEAIGKGEVNYRFVAVSGSHKEVIQDFNENNKVFWKPKQSGNYNLYLVAKDKTGKTVQKVIKKYLVDGDPLAMISFVIDKHSTEVGEAVYLTSSLIGTGTLKYRFVAVSGAYKEVIQDFDVNGQATWIPSKAGTYNIYAVGIDDKGKRIEKVIKKYVVKDRQNIKINSLNSVLDNGKINISTEAYGPSELQYQYWAFDKGSNWTLINDYSTESEISWYPSKGEIFSIWVHIKDLYGNFNASYVIL